MFIRNWQAPVDEETIWSPIKEAGIPAQGTNNPQAWFFDHVVVEYEGMIFDPSYGTILDKPYDNWENAALAFVGVVHAISNTELSYWAGVPNEEVTRETEEDP